MYGFDDFCLPDEVLAAMADLGSTAAADAQAQAPAHALEPSGITMFDAFHPPGPLDAPAVGQMGLQQSTASMANANNQPHLAALGESEVLRARLAQTEKELQCERQRIAQLQVDLGAAKTERIAHFEAELEKLRTDLSFRDADISTDPTSCH